MGAQQLEYFMIMIINNILVIYIADIADGATAPTKPNISVTDFSKSTSIIYNLCLVAMTLLQTLAYGASIMLSPP